MRVSGIVKTGALDIMMGFTPAMVTLIFSMDNGLTRLPT